MKFIPKKNKNKSYSNIRFNEKTAGIRILAVSLVCNGRVSLHKIPSEVGAWLRAYNKKLRYRNIDRRTVRAFYSSILRYYFSMSLSVDLR